MLVCEGERRVLELTPAPQKVNYEGWSVRTLEKKDWI